MWIMELKDKQRRLVNRTPVKENEYVNTTLERSSLSLIHVEENEYEVLRRETESITDQTSSENAPPNPSKRLIYVLVGLVVPLYIAVAAVAIVLIIPKGDEPINGAWSTWGSWENCSATCGFGMERRQRSCTDPVSNIGGKYCFGEPLEYRLCNKRQCAEPKNSSWSTWGLWESCSAPCGFGLERRKRSCTKPEPSIGGKDCNGEPLEYRLCNKQPCAAVHGNWSDWSSWGSCSATCDFGIERRERSCTQPKPSIGGDYCVGEPVEYRTCKQGSCGVVYGNWNNWSPWGSCSATCDFGMERRERSCTQPKPSVGGDYCAGESLEYRTCKQVPCRAVTSGFSVRYPQAIMPSTILTFSTTVYRQGSDYNASTGIFTCSVPGTYLFSVNLVKKRSSTALTSVYCSLYKLSTSYEQLAYIRVYVDPWEGDPDKGSASVSSTVVTSLKAGDTVQLMDCSPVSSMEWWSSFTGVLLFPY